MTIEQRAAMTEEELTDLISDAITDSLEMDWTSRDGARAVVRALRAANVMPVWHPIESAPKDGTLILAPVGHGIMDVVSWWGGQWRETANALAIRNEPTHWQPLPTPPEN